MFKFLFMIILLFALMMFLMGFSVVRTIKRGLFGSADNSQRRRSQQRRQTTNQNQGNASNANSETVDPSGARPRKKIFTKDEGEYVDYEEIK
jgi:hypothetical protein